MLSVAMYIGDSCAPSHISHIRLKDPFSGFHDYTSSCCELVLAKRLRMRFWASHGSSISTNAHRPNPPWLLTAGTQSVRAAEILAALSFFFSPVTSIRSEEHTSALQSRLHL